MAEIIQLTVTLHFLTKGDDAEYVQPEFDDSEPDDHSDIMVLEDIGVSKAKASRKVKKISRTDVQKMRGRGKGFVLKTTGPRGNGTATSAPDHKRKVPEDEDLSNMYVQARTLYRVN